MSYQDFQQKVYSYLIKYKKESLKIDGKGISDHGVEHDCLFPKPYCDEKIPAMLYEGIKDTVKDIQKSKFAYKLHHAGSVHVASSQTACINLFVPIFANRAQMIPMFTLSEYRSFTVVKGAAGHVAGGTFKKRDFTSR